MGFSAAPLLFPRQQPPGLDLRGFVVNKKAPRKGNLVWDAPFNGPSPFPSQPYWNDSTIYHAEV
jgi:hypothetical protein